jgi:hypothetical protein
MRTELDVVNACLALMGQAPLPNLSRPTRQVLTAIDRLKQMNRRLQIRGWWFNTMAVSVVPAAGTNRVDAQLPANTLSVTAQDPFQAPLVLRAPGVLYDPDGAALTTPVKLRVIYEVPFCDLPPVAQDAVEELTLKSFSARIDGDRTSTRDVEQEVAMTMTALNAEHIRSVNSNLLNRGELLENLRRARGTRPFLRYRS